MDLSELQSKLKQSIQKLKAEKETYDNQKANWVQIKGALDRSQGEEPWRRIQSQLRTVFVDGAAGKGPAAKLLAADTTREMAEALVGKSISECDRGLEDVGKRLSGALEAQKNLSHIGDLEDATNEDGLRIMDIREELDEDGNVVSSSVEPQKVMASRDAKAKALASGGESKVSSSQAQAANEPGANASKETDERSAAQGNDSKDTAPKTPSSESDEKRSASQPQDPKETAPSDTRTSSSSASDASHTPISTPPAVNRSSPLPTHLATQIRLDSATQLPEKSLKVIDELNYKLEELKIKSEKFRKELEESKISLVQAQMLCDTRQRKMDTIDREISSVQNALISEQKKVLRDVSNPGSRAGSPLGKAPEEPPKSILKKTVYVEPAAKPRGSWSVSSYPERKPESSTQPLPATSSSSPPQEQPVLQKPSPISPAKISNIDVSDKSVSKTPAAAGKPAPVEPSTDVAHDGNGSPPPSKFNHVDSDDLLALEILADEIEDEDDNYHFDGKDVDVDEQLMKSILLQSKSVHDADYEEDEDDKMEEDEDEHGSTGGSLFPFAFRNSLQEQTAVEDVGTASDGDEARSESKGRRRRSVSFNDTVDVRKFNHNHRVESLSSVSDTTPLNSPEDEQEPLNSKDSGTAGSHSENNKVGSFYQDDLKNPKEVMAEIARLVEASSDDAAVVSRAASLREAAEQAAEQVAVHASEPKRSPKVSRFKSEKMTKKAKRPQIYEDGAHPPPDEPVTSDIVESPLDKKLDADVLKLAREKFQGMIMSEDDFVKAHDDNAPEQADLAESAGEKDTNAEPILSSAILERKVDREMDLAAEKEHQDLLGKRQMSEQYQNIRQKFIHERGGFKRTDSEKEFEPIEDDSAKPKVSRFKAARLANGI